MAGIYYQGATKSNITEFLILKTFGVAGHPARIPGNRPVLCIAPSTGWLKCNSKGLPRLSGYCCLWEYILEQNNINYGLFFSIPWVQFALYAEIMGAIFRIENAFTKGWFRL